MPARSPQQSVQQSVRPAASPLDVGRAPVRVLPEDMARAGASSVQPAAEVVQQGGGPGAPAERRGSEAASSGDAGRVLRVSQLGFDDGVGNFRSLAGV